MITSLTCVASAAGYDAKPGTDKARYNVRGNALYHVLSRELDVPFVENGSLVLCEEESQIQELEALKARGEQNLSLIHI